ncbi:MAG: M48 family metalloprotease [Candidatus Methylacidiphilales bacterium]|nr:M48 family metalloprotease [Candidatus Methylacidiphilales bacterium]
MSHFFYKCMLLGVCLATASVHQGYGQIPLKIPGLGGGGAPRIPGFDNSGGGNVDISKVGEGVSKLVKGALGVNRNEENVIGESVALEIIRKNGGISRDAAMTQRVIRIGRSLTRYAARGGVTYRFGVLNSASPNGFSAPGGYIFLTRGLLSKLKTDEQIAAALAHEISHVMRRHALRSVSKANMAAGLMNLGSSAVGAAGGPSIPVFDNAVESIVVQMLNKGYSTSDEYDADAQAVKLLKDAGYRPQAMAETLMTLDAAMPTKGKLDYHPETKNRIARLQKK